MSNLKLKKEMTVALSNTGRVIWSTDTTYLGGGEIGQYASEAVTVIIGDKITKTLGGAIFAGLYKVRKIYVYNEDMRKSVSNHYANSSVEVKLIEDSRELTPLFSYYYKDLFINTGNVLHVSDFITSGNDGTDDTPVINNAIEFVVNNGGELLFDSNKTYIIKSPILILPPEKTQSNPIVRNFDIDFNGCTIKACITTRTKDDNGNPIPEETIMDFKPEIYLKKLMDVEGSKPIRSTLIYVHSGFANEERMGIIQNVNLISESRKYTVEINENGVKKEIEKVVQIENGMFLEVSPQISYKNISIKDTQRGIFIKGEFQYKGGHKQHTVEVFMDDIHISKSLVENSNPWDISTTIGNLQQSNDVGIDCRATDCHFSKITVEDYLVGMKLIGGDNRVINAHCHNLHSPQQQGCSVGYMNGGTNYYIDCKVTDCFVGWMSSYAVPFFLNNCTWDASNINTNPYRFYISPSNYSGGGIYATNSNVTNPNGIQYALCNVQNNDINLNPPEDNSNNEN